MEYNKELYNAVIIAENPEMGFLIKDGLLHPVEPSVAHLKKEDHSSALLPIMRKALDKLSNYAKDKVEPHFVDSEKNLSLKPEEKNQIIEKIGNIYHHLPRHFRNDLSSLVHHKQNI